MKCTDLCNCKSCSNVNTDEDVETTEEDDDYENFDDDDWDDSIDDEEDLLDNDHICIGSEFLVKRNFLFVLKSNRMIIMLYLITFALFSTVVSKSVCCNIVEFRI